MGATDYGQDYVRLNGLREVQKKAEQLFEAIERDIIRSGISEKALSQEVFELGETLCGIKKYWHKRIVRSGPNTLLPYAENPPDRIIQEDDILIVDLGPIFEAWEADFGRTYVLGNDPEKKMIRDALEPTWKAVRARFLQNTKMTGEELYQIACDEVENRGWEFGAQLAGHLIGNFPHERIPKDRVHLYITRGNKAPINSIGADGYRRHLILEIYIHSHNGQFGGFFEQLLTDDAEYMAAQLSPRKCGGLVPRRYLFALFFVLMIPTFWWLHDLGV